MMSPPLPPASSGPSDMTKAQARARDAAVRLEASFLSEMLKAAGFGKQISTFSGGAGENQFGSFYRDAIARQMATAGGIGLSDHFYQNLMEANDDS